jgi:glyoxylase-like metal-dependent hydrolase (beta-lactamase superfamily II)
MLRMMTKGIAWFLIVVLAGGCGVLAWAHAGIRREQTPLPSLEAAVASVRGPSVRPSEGPVRLSIANTASQGMPRSGVLDSSRDPAPDTPYIMSHPSFVLEWADGRILLVDTGMDRAGAARFGRLIEQLLGGEPIRPHDAVATQLGAAADRVEGAVFTHLHEDHVGGVVELCRGRTRPLRVFMTEAQDERGNYTTAATRRLLADTRRAAQTDADPPCVEVMRVDSGGAQPVPGFPGVAVLAAGGHTPGSQILLAAVTAAGADGPVVFAFTGDIVNHGAGIDHDVPKPTLYRWLVVPEAESRQAQLRHFLRALRDEAGVRLLVSHDELQLARSGLPAAR